ncbi:UNVERIFIED_CONTAM: Transcription repressor OFP7 [Sesamum angustifolium]|uniref:Transcription repressor n=1 Tax=Sesamum angustifolium TaxID=2727405 RepID=A0AAW2NHW3_9LAMI
MAKRFKLRICRVINTTLQSCRSKDPSILPEDPIPSFSRPNPNPASQRPSFNHRLSSAFISFGAACGLPSDKQTPDDHLNGTESQEFKWQKEDKWHVVAKIYEPTTPRRKIYSSSEDDLSLTHPMPPTPPPSAAEKKKRRGKKKKNNVPSRLRMSTSSGDSGWFSSEGGARARAEDERDEEETETMLSSSLSFSTDSSSEFNQLQPIRETQVFSITTNLTHRRNKRRVSKRTKRRQPQTAEAEITARLSVFTKLIPCTVDGKVRESFAIVKRSDDPYEDFKNSMMDMVLEKQMFDPKDLEQLLHCFLSLNSRHYHRMIVEAFSEIWETIFSAAGSKSSIRNHRRVSRPASF